MSGIVGSKFNHRGSGLIGSLGTDGQHLLSSGAGKTNVFETVAAAGVTAAEGTAIRQDISTLALHSAVADNKAAYNLTNSFIDQFEDDTGIGTETTGDRNASEYWGTVTTAAFSSDSNTKVLLHFEGVDGATSTTDSGNETRTVGMNGGAQIDTAQYKIGSSSLLLDGSDDYLDFSASSDFLWGTGDWTFETWFRMNTVGASKTIFWLTTTHDQAYETWININASNEPGYELRNSSGTIVNISPYTAAALSANTWYHWALTKDGANIRQYFDGVQQVANTEGGIVASSTFGNSSAPLWIGRRHDGQYFNGWLDEVRISNTCRYPDGTTFTPNASISATGTLISTANVPTSAQTEVSGVALYKDNAGTASIGTDLKIYFTCNGGTNWTEVPTYTAVTPVFSSGIKMIKLAPTTCTSGSDVRYKAVWANQSSGSKETQLHGIGINY